MKRIYDIILIVLLPLIVLIIGQNTLSMKSAQAAPPLRPLYAPRVITSTLDSGPGTLRQAMLDAIFGDTITFDPTVFPPGSPVTISLTIGLPTITQGNLTIDGSGAGVILDGSSCSQAWDNGFMITSDNNLIKGLQIFYFPASGIRVESGAKYNTISQNVISSNTHWGVDIEGTGTMSNTVIGNLIGTDASGTVAMGNEWAGVWIQLGTQYNVIGGGTPTERNIISGNGGGGVDIRDSGTSYNKVIGNYIGTDINGTTAIPNVVGAGVGIGGGASFNIIGGDNANERNIISGNPSNGVSIRESGTISNIVSGNYIGTDVNGTTAIGNGGDGGVLISEAKYNIIGGNTAGERNIISGNAQSNGGVIITNAAMSNTVSGNYIGTDVSGTIALGNSTGISGGGNYNTIGGSTPGERNVISGNNHNGINIGGGSTHNTVSGNYIGTDFNGTVALPNGTGSGIYLGGTGASDNTISTNTIAFNNIAGVIVDGTSGNTLGNTISRNSIFNNTGRAIILTGGGNTELAAPSITAFDLATGAVGGTACANCTVEIFSDDEDEGQVYEGTATVNGSGSWLFNKGSAFTGPNLTATATDTSGNTSEFGEYQVFVYLPLVLKNAGDTPPVDPPASPTLNDIDNADGDGNYTASWSAVNGATDYTLEEDDNASFTSPTTVYSGVSTSHSVSGKAAGTYYYRVKASNTSGSSGWGNTKSVVVNASLTCEQHDFGSSGAQIYVYADGRTWNFTANSNMSVQTIDVKSVLASYSTGRTFHIQVKINGNTIASWDQYVNSTLYQPYYHSANVSLNLNAGDTITYHIYGGTMSSPAGGITGVNYVKLCGE